MKLFCAVLSRRTFTSFAWMPKVLFFILILTVSSVIEGSHETNKGKDKSVGAVTKDLAQSSSPSNVQASEPPTRSTNGKNGKDSNSASKVPPSECLAEDANCERDRLSFEAIRGLHVMIDDDHNGNVDQSESDEFLRDELQYTDGFERQALFHNNDKLISVDDLWKAWKHSIVYNWTVDDVLEWLVQDVDLPQYTNAFHNNHIDGSVLPRLVNATSPLLQVLGIRNPVHKQKLSLKAMDTVLFGAPKRVHSYAKDLLLISSLIIAIGGCWFAWLHHRYSQTQVKKMMKDLESLQKAEDALKKLSKELADAEKEQKSMPHDKQDELRILRHNSIRLKVPKVSTSGDTSPTGLSREGSILRRQEGERRLQQAEQELASLREALSEAENKLEIQQQLESQWSVPGELQAWLQLTHELEQIHYNAKRQAAERQLLVARDGCDKIKKRNKAFLGSLRMAHSNSLDDIDQSILDARAALEEVKQDLQERLHRWHTIEILCGFPIISNPGLTSLKQALGRDTGAPTTGRVLAPISVDEADEDLPPAALLCSLQNGAAPSSGRPRAYSTGQPKRRHEELYGSHHSLSHEDQDDRELFAKIPEKQKQQIFAWARRSRINWTTKVQQNNDENSGESSIYNQIPERQREQIFAWARRSRMNWKNKSKGNGTKLSSSSLTSSSVPSSFPQSTLTTSSSKTFLKQQAMAGSTNSLSHLGPTSPAAGHSTLLSHKVMTRVESHEPDSAGSVGSAGIGGGSAGVNFHLGDNLCSHHERTHSNASSSQVSPSHNNSKNFTSSLSYPPYTQHSSTTGSNLPNASLTHSQSLNFSSNTLGVGNSNNKIFNSPSGNHLTLTVIPREPLPHAVSHVGFANGNGEVTPPDSNNNPEVQMRAVSSFSNQAHLLEDSDTNSLDSVSRNQIASGPLRSRIDRSPELDLSSLETDSILNSGLGSGNGVEGKKSSKKKKFLPNFLQKNKGKQKFS